MALPLYQVDAFTDRVFGGNPAAVCPLKSWLPDETLQKIAAENNLSETAFFVPDGDGFHLRWFTPLAEVGLCGHATLASAFVIFEFLRPAREKIHFTGASGSLFVEKTPEGLTLDFPAWPLAEGDIPPGMAEALGAQPSAFYKSTDWIAMFDDADTVENLVPDMERLHDFEEPRGIVATAPGKDGVDFVSRAFFPRLGVPEDPVTGSAHCALTPLWAKKLGKTRLKARQVSARGGGLLCELKNNRVFITGRAVLYLQGTINLPG